MVGNVGPTLRRGLLAATLTSGLLLGGCVTVNQTTPGVGHMMAGGAGPGMRFGHVRCTAPRSLPGARVDVVLRDMGARRMMGGVAPLSGHMMLRAFPRSVPSGQVSLVATNLGWRTHELVVLPLRAGQLPGMRAPRTNGTVDESSSLGEASRSCAAGEGNGIQPGTTGWLTLRLSPGRYELVCNRRNHYVDGMYDVLVVS